MSKDPIDTENIEISLLLEAIYRRYGYDFRSYASASLKRRLAQSMERVGLTHFSEMVPRVLYDQVFFEAMLKDLSVTVTEMFRDPGFFLAFRKHLIGTLGTYPLIKIWHAGCATGEEAYSMAIILKEEGLYQRARIYATDYNRESLETARTAIYANERIRTFTANYQAAGGIRSFSDYYHSAYGSARLDPSLAERITFSHHNLVTDGVFGEMNVILCRNVLIYFNKSLQDHVLSLFHESLCRRGFLCLGHGETLDFTVVQDHFEPFIAREKIYRKDNRPERIIPPDKVGCDG